MLKLIIVLSGLIFSSFTSGMKIEENEVENLKVIFADIADYPYLLYLAFYNMHTGDAVLITPNWALTCRFCTGGVGPDFVTVIGNTTMANETDTYISSNIRRAVPHPGQSNNVADFSYDVTLLELETPLNDENCKPAVLGISAPTVAPDAIIVGWGFYGPPDSDNTDFNTLSIIGAPVIDHAKCVEKYSNSIKIGESILCAGYLNEPNNRICFDVNGSPLVVNDTVVGIRDFGFGCRSPDYPFGFMNVAYFYDWISNYTDDKVIWQ